jgi:hypothetical protein
MTAASFAGLTVQSISYLENVHNSDVVDASSFFELRVLEGTLVSVTVALDMQLYRLSASVEAVLADLTSKVCSPSIRMLCVVRAFVSCGPMAALIPCGR